MTEKDEQKLEEEIKKKIKSTESLNERVRLHLINQILLKKKQFDKQLEEEIQKLTKQMEMKSQPLQHEINEIVIGAKKITTEDVESINYLSNEEKSQACSISEQNQMKEFWFKVMKNCDEISRDIKKKDEEALKSLIKIEHKQEESNSRDFSLTFHFLENDYFESPCSLTKKFRMKNEQEAEKATGDQIQWKEGKDLTVKTIEKKQKNKKSGKTRVIKKKVNDESFFNFFKDTEARDDSDDEEQEEEEVGYLIEDQLDIAQFFADELLPYSLEYYFALRKADEDEEGLDDVDEADEEQDEEDDDEEEQAKHKKSKKEKKKPRKRSGVSDKSDKEKKEPQEKPECKQQ